MVEVTLSLIFNGSSIYVATRIARWRGQWGRRGSESIRKDDGAGIGAEVAKAKQSPPWMLCFPRHLALLASNRSRQLALGTLEVHQVCDYLHILTIFLIRELQGSGGRIVPTILKVKVYWYFLKKMRAASFRLVESSFKSKQSFFLKQKWINQTRNNQTIHKYRIFYKLPNKKKRKETGNWPGAGMLSSHHKRPRPGHVVLVLWVA